MITWSNVIKGACTAAYRLTVILLLFGILTVGLQIRDTNDKVLGATNYIANKIYEMYVEPFQEE